MNANSVDIVLACYRDEEDIIVDFINFYLDMGFDKICLVDNGSKDSTTMRINQHPSRDRILLVEDTRIGHEKLLFDFYNYFVDQFNRWCFFIDVDEFIFMPGGIKEYARALPLNVTVLRMPTMVMLPADEAELAQNPLSRSRRQASVRHGDPEKFVWKKVQVHRIFGGKHKVDLEPYVEFRDEQLLVRHYPTRSEQQLYRKLINRLESLGSMNDEELVQSLAFPRENFDHYMELSRQLLAANSWEIEKEQMLTMPWITDTTIKNWFMTESRS